MREMRTVGFNESEATQAMINLMRKMRQPLPSGQVVGLIIKDEPVTADLILEDDYGKRTTITRNATELAAALINYCIERRVRLPTTASKFVEVIGGTLHLVIYMEVEGSFSAKRMMTRANRREATASGR